MMTSAPAPQAVGRLLTHADITPALVGRRAELYWPDDALWYVVQFTAVDVSARRAAIAYATGETEVLNLDDIIADGHMSLMTQELAL